MVPISQFRKKMLVTRFCLLTAEIWQCQVICWTDGDESRYTAAVASERTDCVRHLQLDAVNDTAEETHHAEELDDVEVFDDELLSDVGDAVEGGAAQT